MTSHLCFLLATQRSGTNMLRRVLASHPNLCPLPEVFDNFAPRTHLTDGGVPFFQPALLERIRENPELALPENRGEVVRDYFQRLKEHYVKPDVSAIVDVKYSSLHHGNSAWKYPGTAPDMLSMMKQQNYPVIVLRRNDKLATSLSLIRARESQQYHADKPEAIKPVRFKVDPMNLMKTIRMLEEQDALVNRWLKRLDLNRLELTYEDLFQGEPGSDLDPEVFTEIGRFFGIDPNAFNLNPKMTRMSARGYRKEIENFDEVEVRLRGTPYHGAFVG